MSGSSGRVPGGESGGRRAALAVIAADLVLLLVAVGWLRREWMLQDEWQWPVVFLALAGVAASAALIGARVRERLVDWVLGQVLLSMNIVMVVACAVCAVLVPVTMFGLVIDAVE